MASVMKEEMRTALQLRKQGWVHNICELSVTDCRQRADWCRTTFGQMYNTPDPMTWDYESGKWYGAELDFQAGGVNVNRQFVFMFRDDKLYTMYRMMFPE